MKRFICVVLIALLLQGIAIADQRAWVLCMPGDYVNARAGASRKSISVGRLEAGDEIIDAGKITKGFVFCNGGSFELSEYWVHSGYIVRSQPVYLDVDATVCGDGRVAARKYIDGPRRCWVFPGDKLHVYWRSEIWSITEKGFVQSRYLSYSGG